MFVHIKYLAIALLVFLITACNNESPVTAVAGDTAPENPVPTSVESANTNTQETTPQAHREPTYVHQAEPELMKIFDPWTGDLPQILERRTIRALVPWSDTYFYLDGAEQKGIAFEALRGFEKWLGEKYDFGTVKPHVAILPVRRDQLITFIAQGRGDIALGGITITDSRAEAVDFTQPISKSISEWLIEAPTAERVENIDDLAGREIHVRQSSSYWASIERLNSDFANRGLEPVRLVAADEHFSTEDLMQMANSGVISYTIADSELAEFWANALVDMRVRKDIVVRADARYGWVFRKNSPELEAVLNEFVAENRQGTLLGNIIVNRYLKDTSRLGNIHGEEEKQRLNEVYKYFEQHAPEYDFDTLMMVAQGFQESRLDQSRKSHRGAMGVMQLLPSTAAEPAVGITDISTAENNILAGIRYMAWIKDTYFDDPDLNGFNRTALAFASYNAGPNRVRGLRQKAEDRGLDPDVWFDNVELVAAEDIGRETVDYVANIYKYYFAFKLSRELEEEKR